jgi:hypothetical protein
VASLFYQELNQGFATSFVSPAARWQETTTPWRAQACSRQHGHRNLALALVAATGSLTSATSAFTPKLRQ